MHRPWFLPQEKWPPLNIKLAIQLQFVVTVSFGFSAKLFQITLIFICANFDLEVPGRGKSKAKAPKNLKLVTSPTYISSWGTVRKNLSPALQGSSESIQTRACKAICAQAVSQQRFRPTRLICQCEAVVSMPRFLCVHVCIQNSDLYHIILGPRIVPTRSTIPICTPNSARPMAKKRVSTWLPRLLK